MVLDEHNGCDGQPSGGYGSKLLKPGWAGELRRDELARIKVQLRQSSSLRRRWGFRPSAKRLSEGRIRAVAKGGT